MTEAGWEDGQTIALEVEFSQSRQLAYLLRYINQFVVSDGQDPQVLHVLDVGAQMLKIVVTQVKGSARLFLDKEI